MKKVSERIEDAHRLNNGGQVDNTFERNFEKNVIQCFILGFRSELEICLEEKDTFKNVINYTIDIKRRLAANLAVRKKY